MKILRLVLFAVACYLFTLAGAFAQTVITTGPITINDNVEWTISSSDAPSATAAQALQLRIRDNGQPAFVTISPMTCVTATGQVPGWTCTNKVTTQLTAVVNVRGTHSLVATWVDSQGVESPGSVPFVLTTPAGAPTGFRLIR